MAKKILVTGSSVREEFLQPLRDRGWSVVNPIHLLSEEELTEALLDVDAYLLGGDEMATRMALSSALKLKIIAFLGMGYENYLDSSTARERGIIVTNTPGTLSNAVAELTIGHLLNGIRKIHYYAHLYEIGESGSEEKQRDIAALHHGIVGLGGVGERVAAILRNGFGSQVSYFSRTRKQNVEDALNLRFMDLENLASVVDTLMVLTPGTTETEGLINRRVLDLCRPGLVLVNMARADVVDPKALNLSLESKRVAYAAFDVFYNARNNFTDALRKKIPSRLMVTGHIGSLTHDARDAMGKSAVNSIITMLDSGNPLHRVL